MNYSMATLSSLLCALASPFNVTLPANILRLPFVMNSVTEITIPELE